MLKELLVLFVCLATSRAQVALNPPVPVTAQCYYHTFIGGGVNHCTQGLVPNCAKAAVPGFSYEACDCNLTLSHGIDVIFVLDQLPYTVSEGPTESQKLWEDYLDVLEVAIEPILRRSSDNTIGVIRPTTTGCDTFGSSVLRQGNLVRNFSGTFPYKDLGSCGASACPPNAILSGTCTQTARSILLARSRFRRKIIVSMRHSPGNGGFSYTNEPANNLQYFVITTRPRPSYRVPGTFMSEFDYGGIDKPNNLFVLTTTNIRLINWMLNPANAANPGFILCDTIWPFLRRDVLPAQQAATSGMTCTYFPNGPWLTWMSTLTTGQNVVRRTIPALTSWLCQFTPPTSAPTRSPSTPPTGSPSTTTTTIQPTRAPTSCTGPPPDYVRPYCRGGSNCPNANSFVQVQPEPTLTLNNDGTTTVCYSYTMRAASGPGTCASQNNKPIRGISFMMDECCPDGRMDFVESAKAGIVSPVTKTRNQCRIISWTSPQAGQIDCARVLRPCSAAQSVGQSCGIWSMNDLSINEATSEFCVTVAGQNFDNGAGRLVARDQAKICFERGDDVTSPLNVCTCLPVNFIPSTRICDKTGNPTKRPTTRPTAPPTTVHPTASPQDDPTTHPTNRPTPRPTAGPQTTTKRPSDSPTEKPPMECNPHTEDIPITARTCGYNAKYCGEMDHTEWNVEVEYNMEDDYTMFTYCVDVDDSEEPMCNPSGGSGRQSGNTGRGGSGNTGGGGGRSTRRSSRRSGGSTWGGRRRRLGWSWWNRPRFYNAEGITLRLDDCCELCLSKDHVAAHWDRLQIANFDAETSYLTLTRHYNERSNEAARQCFHLKLKGDIPAVKGKYCVKGGPKCACGEIDVPSSCALKEVADPSCASSSWKYSSSG